MEASVPIVTEPAGDSEVLIMDLGFMTAYGLNVFWLLSREKKIAYFFLALTIIRSLLLKLEFRNRPFVPRRKTTDIDRGIICRVILYLD